MIRLLHFLFALIAFATPWFIGGNYPFTRTMLLLGACIALTIVAGSLVAIPRTAITAPWVWWVLLLGIGFTAFQSAPQIPPFHQTELGNLSSATSEIASPVSVYAPATRGRLVDLICGVGLFVCSSIVFKDSKGLQTVLISLTVVGVLVSFIGVLQILSGDMRPLWQYELLWGGGPFSSFVNSNNAAGFLLVCFSAAMFFVAQSVLNFNLERPSNDTFEGEFTNLRSSKSLLVKVLRTFSGLQSHHLYSLTAIVVICAGIMMTKSRGGMLALVGCVFAAGLMLSRSNRLVSIALTTALIACSAAFIGYTEQVERVTDEVETFTDLSEAAAPRLEHWQVALPYGISNGLLGTGNGTYRYVSPGFKDSFSPSTFAHAENVYIETLVEMGFGGLLLLVICIAYFLHVCFSLFRSTSVFDQALATSGLTCLVGQSASAVLDFGIYQPANSSAVALMMGAIVATYSRRKHEKRAQGSGYLARWVNLAVVTLLLFITLWASYESWGIESRRSARRSIKLLNRYASEGQRKTRHISIEDIEKQLELAKQIRPDDAAVYFLLGDLEICRYRLQRSSELTQAVKVQLNELDGLEITADERNSLREELEAFDEEMIWGLTAVSLLHQQFRLAEKNPKAAAEIVSAPVVQKHLPKALEMFKKSDDLMGLLPNSPLRIAPLVVLCGDPNKPLDATQKESEYIDEALSRSIPTAKILFNCGLLALNSGDQDLAVELWQKCLRRPHLLVHERAIVELSLQMLPMKRFYEEVLPQNPQYLLRIARRYLKSENMRLPRSFLVVHIRRLINQTERLDELEKKLLLARAANQIDDYPEVAKNYGAVLSLASAPAPWRYDYAFALFKTKQFDEAVRQLKVCELDPTFRKNRIKRLLILIRNERSKRAPQEQ